MFTPLPIDTVLPNLQSALQHHPAVVLQAPPGAGKTTRVPLALLNATWLQQQTIILLEPRRLATRAAAQRMADELGEAVGKTVGYRTRFESQLSAQTRIEVVTEGILTRRLQRDPELTGVGLVIFDEFHERSLHADTGLAFCLETQQALRDDLKLLVMSATLDGQAVAKLLGNAPIISSAGRSYPVSLQYIPTDNNAPIAESMANALRNLITETTGDILAFLPGGGEIRRTQQLLNATFPPQIQIYPLYGDLSREAQDQAIRPAANGQRKIVLATPIAETSLTIEGITTVVDSGWRRAPRFDPSSGLSHLALQRVSKAAAEQRAGRAGRLQAGTCYRLWSKEQQERLIAQTPAEILEADLAPLALELAQWGVQDANTLRWLDPPPVAALAQARELLADLEALDTQGRLTHIGKTMLTWSTHPRLAHLLCRAQELGWGNLACDIAALLTERDILRDSRNPELSARLHALQTYRQQGKQAARTQGIDSNACQLVEQLAQQWRKQLRETPQSVEADSAGILLAFAYPDRIAQRRANSHQRYRLANGRGALLPAGVTAPDYLAVAHLDGGQGAEAKIFLAEPVSQTALLHYLSARVVTQERINWDYTQACVVAQREQRLGELIFTRTPLTNLTDHARIPILIQGIQQTGISALPFTEALREWQARILALRTWMPELGLPDISDDYLLAQLDTWLAAYLTGMSRLSHLQKLNLTEILHACLTWTMQQHIDKHAPTHLLVPSGSHIRLQYFPDGQPPILAVRLQELFGLHTTPTIAQGRIKIMLHLLSPARQPIQVTQDLSSFWERTYADVKKELKGRYPKHYWPDDPYQAVATRRVKPRGE
ncbi:ATP-dependent helicase HrpB [Beggiatoa leptomitoformis]|uniref:ATP-dependent helicase HrpB n=1 Tax=Beggiatoa leptomitoformis TaxID=288004 RepID=A0A2N9YA26_9GAMM|nr:ATP-dependent helicase HrpB [Beggiatoa leptomitoformis]ALG67271.1 ATP-dependent helicase HrpB [Beggiatoa leptomitoformis]AUI67304.1 ATP-dependent helicase HrpB [Beggiatoa leptomitoformis]